MDKPRTTVIEGTDTLHLVSIEFWGPFDNCYFNIVPLTDNQWCIGEFDYEKNNFERWPDKYDSFKDAYEALGTYQRKLVA